MTLLWLLCAGVTGQEPCSSPGDFPSPKLSLSTSSAQVGDCISAQCHLRLKTLAALAIFCQDGKEISSQKVMPGWSLYQHDISVQSSGQFRCMYQYRNDQNQVKNSRLSLLQTLNIPGQKLIPRTGPSPEDPASQEAMGEEAEMGPFYTPWPKHPAAWESGKSLPCGLGAGGGESS
ncbi:unnamed protein product [Caretta caretta]